MTRTPATAARLALHIVTVLTVIAGVVVALVTGVGVDGGTATGAVTVSAPAKTRPVFAPPNVPEPTTTSPPATTSAPPPVAPVTRPPVETVPPTTAPPTPSAFAPQLVATLTPETVQVYGQVGDVKPTEAIWGTTWFNNPTALPVTQLGGDWLKVLLPTRPNGSEGWIHARDATLSTVSDTVVVDRANRTLVWTHAGAVQLRATVGIGAASSPTPTGFFFVTDIVPSDPSGSYGAWIIALDAHSDAFTQFQGGDARIAIHGTNQPSTIGGAASNGCVHIDAGSLDRLAHALALGTPVVVQ